MVVKEEEKRHFFNIKKAPSRIRVYRGETLLADTENAFLLKEVGKEIYDGVYYFPQEDLQKDFFEDNEGHQTQCPIKGEASYFNLKLDDQEIENIAWTYTDPIPKAQRIKDHVAFYPNKVSFRIDPLELVS